MMLVSSVCFASPLRSARLGSARLRLASLRRDILEEGPRHVSANIDPVIPDGFYQFLQVFPKVLLSQVIFTLLSEGQGGLSVHRESIFGDPNGEVVGRGVSGVDVVDQFAETPGYCPSASTPYCFWGLKQRRSCLAI